MDDVIVPIFVCVVLPVSIVFIVFYYSSKVSKEKINLLSKAIESGVEMDPEQLMAALETKKKSPKTIKKSLVEKLTGGIMLLILGIAAFASICFDVFDLDIAMAVGSVCAATGIGLVISYFVGKKLLAREIEAESKKQTE